MIYLSVFPEITDQSDETYCDRTTLHPALGRNGWPLGRQPLRGADPRAAVPRAAAADRGRNRRVPDGRALQRQRQPERAAVVEPGERDACAGRPARLFPGQEGYLGSARDDHGWAQEA